MKRLIFIIMVFCSILEISYAVKPIICRDHHHIIEIEQSANPDDYCCPEPTCDKPMREIDEKDFSRYFCCPEHHGGHNKILFSYSYPSKMPS